MKNSLLVFLLLFSFARVSGQSCTLNVNLTSSSPAICSGSSVVLTANTSAGKAPYTWVWNTGETSQSITITRAGTYTVTVTDKTAGCAPVKKNITIQAAPVPNPPTAALQIVCPNTSATLTATAPGGVYEWYSTATGGTLLATGDTYITPPITRAVNYYVQTTIGECTSTRTLVPVRLVANPTVTPATVCSGNPAVLTAAGGDTYAWYDAPNGGTLLGTGATFTTPPLTANTTFYVEATTNGCVTARVPTTVTVTPPPTAPTTSNVTICSGNPANLHASAPNGIFDWYATPTGGTSLISSPDYTTPALTATTTYYVQTSLNGCVSPRTPVIVSVTPIPAPPVVPNVSICSGNAATLTAPTVTGIVYSWYDAVVGGTLLATGDSYTTPVLTSSATYYVLQSNGGCMSARSAVTVTVNQPPVSPTASGLVICSGTTATLQATAPGGVYQWYDAPAGGNLLATNAAYTTPVLTTTTTYYVQTTVAGCVSPRTPVTVSILPTVAAPVASGVTICSGDPATLTATGSGASFEWYDALTGGNFLAAGQVYTTPALTINTTYYVQITGSNGCISPRTPVLVTVSSPPAAPTASGTIVCEGSSATLTASAPGGNITWYDAATGGNLLATGNSFTTPVLSATTTYYVQNNNGSCASARTGVTVTITPVANPQFKYASGSFCVSGPNVIPIINNPSGGTFSATPAGLVFVSTTTGEINVAASSVGIYTITFAGNGACPSFTTTKLSIVATTDAQFAYAGPYCQNGVNPLPTFPTGSGPGVFSASPAGLVFVNTSTGEIDLKTSAPGTYTISNTLSASGSCLGSVRTAILTIDPVVIVNAGPNQTITAGGTATMAGSISGGATTGTWSGGTGSFSNPAALNAVYTPGPGETAVTLTLTSADPAGPCGVKSDNVIITFSPAPPAPTVTGASICEGNTATLSATAPGGTYRWYDASTGGTLLTTGPVYTTAPLTTTTTFYVQTTANGLTSARAPVTVTVNTLPAAPTASPVTVCTGNTATLSASGSTGTYEWYDAPVGGNLLSTNSPYVTTFLSANTSYYVQTVVNGCASPRTQVNVTITPLPTVTSLPSGSICSGIPLNYTITSNTPGATFTWSRDAVPNISNPAVANQASGTITETLINTGASAVNVTYVITPVANGCSGTPFNYVVTVNPAPSITSAATGTVCNETPVNYTITFSSPGSSFTWSRATVAGISNAPVSGQTAGTIKEVLFNTTTVPVNVTYIISYTSSGCSGSFSYTVTVYPSANITSAKTGTICSDVPQSYTIISDVSSATFTWSRAAVSGISNPAVSGQTSNVINETLTNTSASNVRVNYIITPTAYGCPGDPFTYSVLVAPAPLKPQANANTPVCLNSTIKLQTPVVVNATYVWSGPNAFASNLQNPTISNVTMANAGTYSLYVIVNGCASQISTVDVQVDDLPTSNAGTDLVVCTNVTSVALAGVIGGGTTTGIWSTTNGTGTFSPSPTTLNADYIPSAQDKVNGNVITLTLSSTSKDDCNLAVSSINVKFQAPVVTSAPTGGVCTGVAQNYIITSDDAAATFIWSRAAVPNISNTPVTGQTSGTISEILNNVGSTSVDVVYQITPVSNGCPGKVFTYTVTVYPQPATPTVTLVSPVCVGSTIHLQTPTVPNATYMWTGPNAFSSNLQNPDIVNVTTADAGTYNVVVLINGCSSLPAPVQVKVHEPSVATAGNDQSVCISATSIVLSGTVIGGSDRGSWSTSGTGTFSPSGTLLNTQYIPSDQDRNAGSVVLTLSSVSDDDCTVATSSLTVTFQPQPAVDAGDDIAACSQDAGVQLHGKLLVPAPAAWTTSGTGTFSPSASVPEAIYVPSTADIQAGYVTLTLTVTNPGACFAPSDQMILSFVPPPTVNAGGTRYVLKDKTITLTPTVSDQNVQYLWSPDIDISSTTAKNPVITGTVDRTYTLTVTDSRGCITQDQVLIKVSPEIVAPNTFTPNGDGVNDLWTLQGIEAYQNAIVDIFDRYGQKVFHSAGYGKAWDGTYNGKAVPYGVYYYVINTNLNGLMLTGYVTVVR